MYVLSAKPLNSDFEITLFNINTIAKINIKI